MNADLDQRVTAIHYDRLTGDGWVIEQESKGSTYLFQ
jgi:hypothetical protein